MRIYLAGATGALGQRLLPLLVAAGHEVTATTTKAKKVASLRAAGATAVVVDGLDREAVRCAVQAAKPDVVVHQMTALASLNDLRNFDRDFRQTNRLRTEGTDHLLTAAVEAGAKRAVMQSYAGWPSGCEGAGVTTEDDALDANPPQRMKETLGAIRYLESRTMGTAGIEGIVLRYGGFYGPGTGLGPGGSMVEAVKERKVPVVGSGGGVWSFIHIDDAARATLIAIERGTRGIYNIVDDDPAEVAAWVPALARAAGAKAPRHIPGWIGRLLIGEAGMALMTKIRGSSNAKAKRVLGWRPSFPTWREGFEQVLAQR